MNRHSWDALDLADEALVSDFVAERAMSSRDAGPVVSDDTAADWIVEAYKRGLAAGAAELAAVRGKLQADDLEARAALGWAGSFRLDLEGEAQDSVLELARRYRGME